ncbi:hypothetical protein SEA_NIGHTMARE_83 [Arthrobacter phage Nightmare]|uniref:Uncharacterized protein n=1 Tax=Arthrobacter phage Nightmare TaxID=2015864 RepID=A0A221J6L8_9CAUD|nr:hypothetical protein QCN33_gp83 [Arthrobacter phage Nightmare]ASM62356.1 hypothetical protein SEA_NIGHTMARE_83 [Arthrobacter phage Nightmare]
MVSSIYGEEMSTELIPIVGMHRLPVVPSKITIDQWQQDVLVDLLKRNVKTLNEWQTMWAFIREHFEVRKLEQKGGDEIKDVYVFFGYKKDAAKWRSLHGIDPRDMVVARNAEMLVGRRARPIRLNQDSEWYWLNWDHLHSMDARYQMAIMEGLYGTADASAS